MKPTHFHHQPVKDTALRGYVCPAGRRALVWLVLAVVFFVSGAAGLAAAINWGTPMTVSGDSDVINSGSALYAYAGGAATVNGVTFAATSNGTTWGNASFTSFGGFNSVFGATAAPFTNLSAAYRTVLATAAWGSGTSGTVTLNGLISGHAYSVQIWVNDSRGGYQSRYESVTSSGGNTVTLYFAPNSNSAGAVGQFVVGTFTASGTSQTFSVNGNAVVQINAISVRDNGYVGIQSNFTPSRFNLAKYQPVFTDSTNGTQTAAYLTDGFVTDNSGWTSDNSGPHWAGVTFPFPVTVGSAQLAMGLNNASPLTVFWLQYLTNGAWVNVPGTTIVGNTNVERNIVFTAPITSSSFRVYDSLDSPIRIRQLALYPPNGTNGYPFGADFLIDVARKQPTFATANTYGNWPLLAADGLVNANSAWQTTLVGSNSLLVNLQFTNKIGSAHLYSGATGVAPLTNFVLQYWTGSAWANIPGGSISGNSSSVLVIPFTTPVTTTKVQLLFTNASTSAVQELCLFPANSNGGYPLGTGIISNTPVSAKYAAYSDSYYYLSNSATAKVVIESNGLPVMGSISASTWATRTTNWPAQYQVLLNYDNGTYRLINRNSGLCLAGAQMTTNAGALLAEETYSALPDQDWFLQTVDGVNFYLLNQFSGLVADSQNGALVQNVQTNSTSQYWQIALTQIFPKKGIAHTGNNIDYIYHPYWCHDYGPGTSAAAPPGVVYHPADEQPQPWYGRGSMVANNYWSLQPVWRTTAAATVMLGYCEPDNALDYFDPTNRSAIAWVNEQNLDLPLTAPAAANVLGTWIPAFLSVVTNWGCRFEAMPSHEYSGNNSSASSAIWINSAQTAYNNYGLPIWMTEFNIVDWGGTGNWSEEDNYNALAEFLWRVESVPWFQKYSLFVWSASASSPMAPNPWTRTTPAPSGYGYDTNKVLTPFAELYGGWDGDTNVETNKTYFIHNSGTRKQLANMSDPQLPDAKNILVRDNATQWTLQPAPTASQYYLVSAADGRRLSYNGTTVTLAAANTAGTAVQWSLTSYQYGWYYLDHPATSKRLQLAYNNSTSQATFTMVATSTTSTAVQWRFIVPYTPSPVVWTGGNNATWASTKNWVNTQLTPPFSQTANNLVVFNNLSTSNLNTVLNLAGNPAVSNIFTVYGLTVSNVAGPVSIGATNTLVIGNYIDLSQASQNLTITAPVLIGESQGYARHFWTVASGRTLSLNGSVAGANDLIIAGGGTVSLGGTNVFDGSTTINASTLTISGAGQLGGGNYTTTITDNGIFNYNSSADQTLSGNISGSGSLAANGVGTLTLTGTNTYTGNTTIGGGGTLALNGNGSIASSRISLAGGGTFDVSGLNTAFALGGARTLTNSSVGALLNGSLNCSAGTLSLVTDGVNPAFVQTNGALTLSANTVMKVNNTGGILGVGNHPLLAAAAMGNQGLVNGALPSVVVTGNGAAGTVALQSNVSGGLDLVVTSTTSTNPTNINFTFSNGTLMLTWPGDHLGWIAQSNAVNLANSNYWFDILGSQSATNLVIPINPAAPTVFYRLRYPF